MMETLTGRSRLFTHFDFTVKTLFPFSSRIFYLFYSLHIHFQFVCVSNEMIISPFNKNIKLILSIRYSSKTHLIFGKKVVQYNVRMEWAW